MGYKQGKLGLYALVMLSVVAIFNPRTLPLMAEYGLGSITYYVLVALLFFIPSSLVCAELATGWPEKGGVYVWIREAFGDRLGFLGIWLEWINNVVGWPSALALISARLAYAISPQWASDKTFMIIMMLVLFWSFTLLNYYGLRVANWLSHFGLIAGTVLPTLLIILLGGIWLGSAHTVQMPITWQALLPKPTWSNTGLLIGVMLGFAGMQITAYHANDVINPQKHFPRAIFIATVIILLGSILGSLSIAAVIPHDQINIVSGNIQTLQYFLAQFHLSFLEPVFALAMALGAAAMLNAWISGPSKGLLVAAEYGNITQFFAKTNRHGAPVVILLCQAIVVSILAILFKCMPTIENSYWLVTDLSAIMTLMMTVMFFASVIRLRYTQPERKRPYQIPGGKLGVWLVAGSGLLSSVMAIVLGFLPPEQLHQLSITTYELVLIMGLLICIVPVAWVHRNKHQN